MIEDAYNKIGIIAINTSLPLELELLIREVFCDSFRSRIKSAKTITQLTKINCKSQP